MSNLRYITFDITDPDQVQAVRDMINPPDPKAGKTEHRPEVAAALRWIQKNRPRHNPHRFKHMKTYVTATEEALLGKGGWSPTEQYLDLFCDVEARLYPSGRVIFRYLSDDTLNDSPFFRKSESESAIRQGYTIEIDLDSPAHVDAAVTALELTAETSRLDDVS